MQGCLLGDVDDYLLSFGPAIDRLRQCIDKDRVNWDRSIKEQERMKQLAREKIEQSMAILRESLSLKFTPGLAGRAPDIDSLMDL